MSGLDDLFDGLPKRLDVDQVAEVLGMNKRGVYTWLQNGTLPGYKLGHTWFVLTVELKQALRDGSNRAAMGHGEDPETLRDGE